MENLAVRVSALWQDRLIGDMEAFDPTHLISMIDPGKTLPEIPAVKGIDRLSINARDHTDHNYQYGTDAGLSEIDTFLDQIIQEAILHPVRVVVHCQLGASRSPAIAYSLLAKHYGRGNEDVAFRALLGITNKPWPNRGIVAYFDKMHAYNGALLAPLDEYRTIHPKRHAAYRRLNVRLGRVRYD